MSRMALQPGSGRIRGSASARNEPAASTHDGVANPDRCTRGATVRGAVRCVARSKQVYIEWLEETVLLSTYLRKRRHLYMYVRPLFHLATLPPRHLAT